MVSWSASVRNKNAQASHSSIGQMCLRAFEALVTVLQTRSNGLVDEGKHGHASRNLSTPLQGDGIVPLGSDSAPDGGQETEQPFHRTIFQRQLLGIKTPLNTVYRCLHPAWKWCSFYHVLPCDFVD